MKHLTKLALRKIYSVLYLYWLFFYASLVISSFNICLTATFGKENKNFAYGI